MKSVFLIVLANGQWVKRIADELCEDKEGIELREDGEIVGRFFKQNIAGWTDITNNMEAYN